MTRRRGWLAALGVAAVAAAVGLGCSLGAIGAARFHRVDEPVGGSTKHYRESRFQFTEQSRFSVELLVKDALRVGANRPLLILHDAKDQDVEGANVTAVARDPEESAPDRPLSVTDDGAGRYRLEKWEVDRPGEVLLEIRIHTRSAEDRVVFRLPAVLPGPAI